MLGLMKIGSKVASKGIQTWRSLSLLAVANVALSFVLFTPSPCFPSPGKSQEKGKHEVRSNIGSDIKKDVQRDFTPPYPFTTQEFLVNLGKILSAKDGVVRKEAVAKVFQIEIPNKPRDEDLADYKDGLIFRVLPGRDWYIGMMLVESKDQVHFDIWFNSYFCIGISEFRQFAEDVGWEMVVAATLSGHKASPREYYKKRGNNAELFFDMSRPYLQCIGSIFVSTPKVSNSEDTHTR